MSVTVDEPEDILNDALEFLGGKPVVDSNVVRYGNLTLSTARKEGKANTLLADHLFSPGLFLAERIERRLLELDGKTVVELGAGVGLPSILAATISPTPSLVIVTDYPDENILGNLKGNVERNRTLFATECTVQCAGYDWGKDAQDLLLVQLEPDMQGPIGYLPTGRAYLPLGSTGPGFDAVILSDLLHFDSCHDVLVTSICLLLRKHEQSRFHVSAGNYTRPAVCDSFLQKCQEAGLKLEEIPVETDKRWLGKMIVSGLNEEELTVRKSVCRYWIGRWASVRMNTQ